ncbi:hypothetical protein OEZ86_010289 [Tetradesmus obliquus]|uniref:GH26 domain-containing protein n=1 Tax=Tetradesmus obliquus TaxID=3088 RepID=A0A383VTR1_TETOB|nr:hypothetical protein OEZ86_010289 [Tetradesmus obliquus]|eukprot:jgi/Sobl393_1/8602/SZX68888.1
MAVWCLMLLCFSSLANHSAARPAPRPAAELSNSFIITSLQDLEQQNIHGTFQTPCEYAVRRARAIGGKQFSIVVTAYWQGGPGGVQNWAFKDVSNAYSEGFGFLKPDVNNINRWKRGLQGCFRSAILSGFTGIQILNHVDDSLHTTWRNLIDFDPLQQYGGYSYEDVVVRPAADALRTVTRPSTKVWFMVMGEMGRSLFRHPGSYMKLISKYRGTLARGKVGANVKVGFALHWNKVCGNCFFMPYTRTAQQYNATYSKAFADQRDYIKGNYDLGTLKRVFEIADVLGISHYAPMPTDELNFASFELPFMTTAYELKFWGVNLKGLVQQSSKDFLFSEVGLGGAQPDGRSTAADLQSLAENVENGIWAVYNTAQDPWQRQDFRDYRKKWFYNLLGFLRYGGSPNVKINAAFVWSVGSFDVAGVHPISTSSQGSYADNEIVGWMKRLSAMSMRIVT